MKRDRCSSETAAIGLKKPSGVVCTPQVEQYPAPTVTESRPNPRLAASLMARMGGSAWSGRVVAHGRALAPKWPARARPSTVPPGRSSRPQRLLRRGRSTQRRDRAP
eukprot:scaffold6193_cov123-Isochrysis_galbana.AAC.7